MIGIKTFKDDWRIMTIFGVIFGLSPWVFFKMPFEILGAALICIYLFSKERTWVMLLPLLLFLYPSQLETEVAPVVKMVTRKAPAFIEYPLLLFFVIAVIKRQIHHYSKFVYPTLGLIFLGVMYSLYYGTNEDIVNTIFFIVNYVCVYLLIINCKISIKQYLNVLEVVFVALSTYAILEYFYSITPYQDLYYITNGFTFINRASSLCGHPLVFVGFLCFYQIYLYARIVVFGKMPYISISLLILMSILTASRTAYLVDGFLLVSYLVYIMRFQRNSKATYSVIGILIMASIVFYYFSDQYMSSLERFSGSTASTENRYSAFVVSWNVFVDNLFGVGYHLKSIIDKYTHFAAGFTMNVLDNVFLALLCRYGIFMFVYLMIFLQPFKITYKRIKNNRSVKFIFILLCVNILALSFSFIFIDFFPFVLFTSCTLGFIYKLYEFKNGKDEKCLSTNVNL